MSQQLQLEREKVVPWILGDGTIIGPQTLRLLEELLENCGPLIAILDQDNRLRFANKACREAMFFEKFETATFADVMRRNYAAGRGVRVPAELEAVRWSQTVPGGKMRNYLAFESDLQTGRWFYMTETLQPNGWKVAVGVDVTELRASNRKLRVERDTALKASQTDDLTGISNRRHILQLTEEFLAGESPHPEKSTAACLFDIDLFKRINDQFGHQTGDAVLAGFARTIQKACLLRDCFGRVGGEEFLLLMPGCSLDVAIATVNNLQSLVRESGLVKPQPAYPVTFSAGVTMFSGSDTVDLVYARCDRALYTAKAEGRNRVSALTVEGT